ncbi:MAG: hypothetical protein V1662_01315 [Candidatus Omnitrophota bacterium]
MKKKDKTSIRYIARALSLVWALWWVFFGLACGVFHYRELAEIIVHSTLPGLFFLLTALFAWKWESPGGIALIVEGITAFIIYLLYVKYFSISTLILALMTMSAPAIIAGSLLLKNKTQRKKNGK